jgi:hypothetical protein
MTPKILVKFATRSRPEKFINCLENYISLSTHDNYEILVSADWDDLTMNNPGIITLVSSYEKVRLVFGASKNKVDAINRDVSIMDNFDILINTSDDMCFVKKGFDSIIVQRMQENFPDFDGVLHFDDGNHYGSKLMTMSIMGKPYYDRFGYIYFPGYDSVYCDNEAKDVALKLGKYKYFPEVLFNHNHPVWGKAQWDEQYRLTEKPSNYQKDGLTYNIRKKNKFYLFEQQS